jgi:hypothetical protein
VGQEYSPTSLHPVDAFDESGIRVRCNGAHQPVHSCVVTIVARLFVQ